MRNLLVIFFLLGVVAGWSNVNRNGYHRYLTHKKNRSYAYSYYQYASKSLKACRDRISPTLCGIYENSCEYKQVYTVCKKTCLKCTAVSPLSCHASRLGCCWDNISKVEHGCPDCVDRRKSCKKVGKYCKLAHIMRVCPETCGACTKCKDDEHQAEFCPYWKNYGMCDHQIDLMKKYCTKTCGFCKGPKKPEPYFPSPGYYHRTRFSSGKREVEDIDSFLNSVDSKDTKKVTEEMFKRWLDKNSDKKSVTNDESNDKKDDELYKVLSMFTKKRDTKQEQKSENQLSKKEIEFLNMVTKSNEQTDAVKKDKKSDDFQAIVNRLLEDKNIKKQSEEKKNGKNHVTPLSDKRNIENAILKALAQEEEKKEALHDSDIDFDALDKRTKADDELLKLLVNDAEKKQQ